MKLLTGIAVLVLIAMSATLTTLPTSVAQSNRQQPRPQATPQRPQKVGEGDVIRVDSDLVTLTATVVDSRGRYAANLRQKDFAVYEDGVKQELVYFSTGDRVPVSLGILFDTSGSMLDKIEGVSDAVEHFVKSVAPGDEIFLIRFSYQAEIVQDFTDDRRRILRAVEDLKPEGKTALYDAIVLGLQRVAQGKHQKRALLLVTDGKNTTNSVRLEMVRDLARRSEVTIYAMGIGHGERGSFGHDQTGDEIDMKVLNAFADATAGRAFYLEGAHAGGRDLIDEAAAEVAAELKQQYTLGYRPTNRKRDSTFREIKVELPDKSLRVRTKRGYYAQQPG
jgi:Ca-activated chloride channel family protein